MRSIHLAATMSVPENERISGRMNKARELAVPRSQLKPADADDSTRQAVEDWLYWVKQGYEF